MGKFIRQNLVLVAGITLPVLLVAGFLLLTQIPKALTDPPTYDFLVSALRYDQQSPAHYELSFEVKNGVVMGRITPTEAANRRHNRQRAALMRYRVETQTFEQVEVELPGNLDEISEVQVFPIQALSDTTILKPARAPDGYVFKYIGRRGRGGLLGEIFGMGGRRHHVYVLKKDNAYYDLPLFGPENYYYSQNVTMLGWIAKPSEQVSSRLGKQLTRR